MNYRTYDGQCYSPLDKINKGCVMKNCPHPGFHGFCSPKESLAIPARRDEPPQVNSACRSAFALDLQRRRHWRDHLVTAAALLLPSGLRSELQRLSVSGKTGVAGRRRSNRPRETTQ
jgi:hypothetical protein